MPQRKSDCFAHAYYLYLIANNSATPTPEQIWQMCKDKYSNIEDTGLSTYQVLSLFPFFKSVPVSSNLTNTIIKKPSRDKYWRFMRWKITNYNGFHWVYCAQDYGNGMLHIFDEHGEHTMHRDELKFYDSNNKRFNGFGCCALRKD